MNSIAVIGCVYISFVSICITDVHSNWMYLGLVGVPPPLQQQQGEPGTALDDPGALKANAVCEGLTSLSAEQLEVCMKHPNMINPVASGARKGIQECQYQFKNERWNCSTSEDDQDVFGYVLKSGSKETAFIYAVTSAGVVHSVTQTCSSGTSPDCICDTSTQGRSTPEGWKWGGCSDNIDYGIEFARKFIDSPEQLQPHTKHDNKLKHRIQMNLHNNEAGREIVQSLMRSHCRCHGVSGSCELKTCWRTVPPFNDIGDVIKQKYNDAVMLRLSRKSRSKRNKVRTKKEIKKSDLVHVNKSPNFCKYNPNKGIPGTKGRICNITSGGPDSCDVLCCGRGYVTQVVKIKEKCHCKFVWCCYVKCKTCEKELLMHSCK